MKRYSRNFPIISNEEQRALSSCRVILDRGVSPCALTGELLVRAGVQTVHVLSDSGIVQRLADICSFGDFRVVYKEDISPSGYDLAVLSENSPLTPGSLKTPSRLKAAPTPPWTWHKAPRPRQRRYGFCSRPMEEKIKNICCLQCRKARHQVTFPHTIWKTRCNLHRAVRQVNLSDCPV